MQKSRRNENNLRQSSHRWSYSESMLGRPIIIGILRNMALWCRLRLFTVLSHFFLISRLQFCALVTFRYVLSPIVSAGLVWCGLSDFFAVFKQQY